MIAVVFEKIDFPVRPKLVFAPVTDEAESGIEGMVLADRNTGFKTKKRKRYFGVQPPIFLNVFTFLVVCPASSPVHTTMDNSQTPEPIFNFVYDYVEKDKLTKYLRLVIVVCVYIFLRSYYSNWAKTKYVKDQLALDKKEKEEEKEKKLDESRNKIEKLDAEASGFGWGKATRRKVKTLEIVVNETMAKLSEREQSAYDAAEDHDIEDLLE